MYNAKDIHLPSLILLQQMFFIWMKSEVFTAVKIKIVVFQVMTPWGFTGAHYCSRTVLANMQPTRGKHLQPSVT
jgi:hypothetical protein